MPEFDFIDEDRYRHVQEILQELLDRCEALAIQTIKDFPEEARASGDDSVLDSFWEEFKYQVQREQFVCFDVYEESVRAVCRGVATELPHELRRILWLWTDAYFDAEEDDNEKTMIPADNLIEEVLEQELYTRVVGIAETEELKVDPDVERDRERFEDDIRGYFGSGG